MKKLFIISTLLAVGTIASNAATTLYVGTIGGSDSKDISSVSSWHYFNYLYEEASGPTRPDSAKGNVWAGVAGDSATTEASDGSVYSVLTTSGNTTYALSNTTSSFEIGTAMYFDSFTNSASDITINFGTSGSLTTVNELNFGSSAYTSSGSITLALDFTDDLLTTGRVILTGYSNWGIWNIDKAPNLTISLAGYTSVGQISSVDDLNAGEVGMIFSEGGSKTAADTITIVAKAIPEPSLFGLFAGTLALGLAGTRRRRGNAK